MNSINSKFPLEGYLDSKQGGRAENQDFMGFADTPHGFLLVLCDGMGGGPAGRLASTTVVDEVIKYVSNCTHLEDRRQILTEAIKRADERIAGLVAEAPQLTGMGTTLAAVLLNARSAIVTHVGDSRVYQFRMGKKVFRTADHSRVGELVRMGKLTEEQARLSAFSNQIIQAINGHGIAKPDFSELAYDKGDRFMLCSDGIWGMLPEPELIKKVAKGKDAKSIVYDLSEEIDEAGRAAGNQHDNLSIAVFEPQNKSKKKIPMSKRILTLIVALLFAFILSLVALFACYSYFSKANHRLESEVAELTQKKQDLHKALAKSEGRLEESLVAQQKAEKKAASAQEAEIEATIRADKAENKAAEAAKNAAEADQRAKNAENQLKKVNSKLVLPYQLQINTLKNWKVSISNGSTITDASIQSLISQLDKNKCKSAIDNLKQAQKVAKNANLKQQDKNKRLTQFFTNAITELEKIKK